MTWYNRTIEFLIGRFDSCLRRLVHKPWFRTSAASLAWKLARRPGDPTEFSTGQIVDKIYQRQGNFELKHMNEAAREQAREQAIFDLYCEQQTDQLPFYYRIPVRILELARLFLVFTEFLVWLLLALILLLARNCIEKAKDERI